MNEFGNRLVKTRKLLNVSQADLAKKCRIAKAMMSKYENGRNDPKLHTAMIIAANLDVSLDFLCGLTESQTYNSQSEYYIRVDDNEKDLIEKYKKLPLQSKSRIEERIEILLEAEVKKIK